MKTGVLQGELLRKKKDPNNKLNPDLVSNLISAISDKDVAIVIASTWKAAYSFKELKNFFPKQLQDIIIDITPEHPNPSIGYVRERECMAWLRLNVSNQSYYVAIDDDKDLYRRFPLVKIDPFRGVHIDLSKEIVSNRKLFKIV